MLFFFSRNVQNHKHHFPYGDLFHYFSSPHFFSAIIILISINLLFLAKHEVLVCIWTFVTSNQVISAILAHRWYKENFKGYPKERRALIPYIFQSDVIYDEYLEKSESAIFLIMILFLSYNKVLILLIWWLYFTQFFIQTYQAGVT